MRVVLVLIIPAIMLLLGNLVFATSFSVDKSTYQSGDDILLSGSVSPLKEGSFISVQILNPPSSDFAQIDTFLPSSDGSFSRTYKADGPKWIMDGTYTLKLFYNGEELQTSFGFSNIVEPEPSPEVEHTQEAQPEPAPKVEVEPSPETESTEENSKNQEPKTYIPGFPALDKAPQYYLDRYSNEVGYKDWFDSQFPGKTIEDVVGYKSTHINNFPDNAESPQYYISRYKAESGYQGWFESQFPGKTVYEVLGFPDPVAVPEWIKSNAEWWSLGQISDDEFIQGIQFMIENEIITIPNIPESGSPNSKDIPEWIRNNANWWALGKISEDDFVNGMKFLIESGVIIINYS